ncbi:hypothetical protein GQ43DRAFT_443342 [Delitschia confertaspora ATCC 74209]|uniref:Uncharacterized protein n=1 Tax=Delitschia confertaspora ATCC 74209 TaxID=1513339 RepID=A0A9P4JJS4_9PLEO|nr:hypothetical protein GQ43DRAFT_443342 [Delitschia confertaspora ATCC 74209]
MNFRESGGVGRYEIPEPKGQLGRDVLDPCPTHLPLFPGNNGSGSWTFRTRSRGAEGGDGGGGGGAYARDGDIRASEPSVFCLFFRSVLDLELVFYSSRLIIVIFLLSSFLYSNLQT